MVYFFFLMIRRPPGSTRTDTLFPYTTLFRSWYAASRAVRSVEGPHVPDAPGVAPRAIRPALVLRSHTVQQCAREHARPRGCFVARQYRRTCVKHGPSKPLL